MSREEFIKNVSEQIRLTVEHRVTELQERISSPNALRSKQGSDNVYVVAIVGGYSGSPLIEAADRFSTTEEAEATAAMLNKINQPPYGSFMAKAHTLQAAIDIEISNTEAEIKAITTNQLP